MRVGSSIRCFGFGFGFGVRVYTCFPMMRSPTTWPNCSSGPKKTKFVWPDAACLSLPMPRPTDSGFASFPLRMKVINSLLYECRGGLRTVPILGQW